MKNCPKCKLINTDSAQKCACGYDFLKNDDIYTENKKRNNIIVIGIFVFLIIFYIFVLRAPSYKQINLSKKNPTEYNFNNGYDDVSNAIMNGFPDCDYHEGIINVEGSKIDIDHGGFYSIDVDGYSPSYSFRFKDEQQISFWATFYVYIDSINIYQSKVKIKCKTYTINLGETFLSPLFRPLGHAFFHTKKVESTTIEEYEILLKIGEKLNIKESMPKLNLN